MTQRAFLFTSCAAFGAIDVGVLHALADAGIDFQVYAGQGAGAVNAAALVGGLSPERLAHLWLEHAEPRRNWLGDRLHPWNLAWRGGQVFRLRRDLWALPWWRSVLDLEPLRQGLERHLPEEAVRHSESRLQVFAWNLEEEEVTAFGNDWFRHDQILASCSVPHLLPPVHIEQARYCDPTLLAPHSPLSPLALGAQGVEEIYFPLPRLRTRRGDFGWIRNLSRFLLETHQAQFERDLFTLGSLPEGQIPRLVPVAFEATMPATAGVDYSRPHLHQLLDLGYDRTRQILEEDALRKVGEARTEAPSRKRSAPEGQSAPEERSRPGGGEAVSRLRKALGETPHRKKKRKQPSLGF